MLKISDATNLAMHAMVYIAAVKHNDPVPVGEIAQIHGVSEAHLGKVLQRLVKLGLLKSRRGPKGGFALDKQATQITLLDIYEAIEGPLSPIDCLLTRPICDGGPCIMGGCLNRCIARFSTTCPTLDYQALSPPVGVTWSPVSPRGRAALPAPPRQHPNRFRFRFARIFKASPRVCSLGRCSRLNPDRSGDRRHPPSIRSRP